MGMHLIYRCVPFWIQILYPSSLHLPLSLVSWGTTEQIFIFAGKPELQFALHVWTQPKRTERVENVIFFLILFFAIHMKVCSLDSIGSHRLGDLGYVGWELPNSNQRSITLFKKEFGLLVKMFWSMFQDKRKIMQKNWVMLLPPLGFWTLAQKQTLNGQSTIHPPSPTSSSPQFYQQAIGYIIRKEGWDLSLIIN